MILPQNNGQFYQKFIDCQKYVKNNDRKKLKLMNHYKYADEFDFNEMFL